MKGCSMVNVALVHDWVIHMRGGEKVLESMAEIYPNATIYTLFYNRKKLSPALKRMKFQASFLQYLPGIRKFYRWLLPILPFVVRTLKIPAGTQVVLSTSHCVAKGIPIPPGAIHISYIHTPMRYIWGFGETYFGKFPKTFRPLIRLLSSCLRRWDLGTNRSVHHFIANSENVRRRIRRYYHREATVIYPPVNNVYFYPEGVHRDYYLAVSAFVPYKKIDLVIEAFNRMKDQKLLIVGSGPMQAQYEKLRTSPNIIFSGSVPDNVLRKLYSEALALIFPTEEDFGIVPLEAQACGTPVIAFGKGGALESVKSGTFFPEQTADSIAAAVRIFSAKPLDRSKISEKMTPFGKITFKLKVAEFVEKCVQ